MIAIVLIALIALSSFITFAQLNKTYYVHYTDKGNVDYKVHIVENGFYEDEWLEKDKAYITNMIDNIFATFTYEAKMDSDKISYDYSYRVDAELKMIDNQSGCEITPPLPAETIKELTTYRNVGGDELKIQEQLNIDFAKYNNAVEKLVDAHSLKCTSTLVVTMTVDIISNCPNLEGGNVNSYFISLNIPLDVNTTAFSVTSSVDQGESKVIACSTSKINPLVFKAIGIIFTVLTVIALAALIAFIYLTRNEDINYSIKIKRILSSYRSFIQKINNEFDSEGYQILEVSTFNEMLGIRDTIQSPILMNENEDKTRSLFFIPTNTKILYVHEIKVENYDQIYGETEPEIEEPVILVDNVDEEELAEAMSEPDVVLENVDFVKDNDPEEEDGVEVIGVVWPEKPNRNKVYRYDPNGEQLSDGDIVLVPSRDAAKNKEVIRKAAVAHGNHKVPEEMIHHPLKKIIGVVKRKTEEILVNDKEVKKETKKKSKR